MKDENKIKRVKFTRNGMANKEVYRAGDIVDLPESEARQVLLAGRGEETKEQPRRVKKQRAAASVAAA
ncbi:MAG: hypothetical protein SFX19_10120 [Alphaproteobacteria bacterium]|nr:hypothetical protein [Alphaproteobacteria bacterium]